MTARRRRRRRATRRYPRPSRSSRLGRGTGTLLADLLRRLFGRLRGGRR